MDDLSESLSESWIKYIFVQTQFFINNGETKRIHARGFVQYHFSKAKLIHSKKTEWAYTIDHAGNLFRCETGDEDFVDVPEDKFTSANIILHNHPHDFKEPSSFSGIDVFNLLYYKPKEIVLCSYGMYFRMSDAGCQKLPTDVRRELDGRYNKISKKLFKRYVHDSFETKGDLTSNYKKFKVCLEREFRVFLKEYAKENNLLYSDGKL